MKSRAAILKASPLGAMAYFLKKTTGVSRPRLLFFEISDRCNLRCSMCFLTEDQLSGKTDEKELTTEEILSFLKSVPSPLPVVGFSGGEPFLRKDMILILKEATRMGFESTILTNGTTLIPKLCEEILTTSLIVLTVSLDGPEAVHEHIRKQKGCFQKSIQGIRTLQEMKRRMGKTRPKVNINCVIQADNIDHLHEMVPVAKELGVTLQFQHLIWQSPQMCERHTNLMEKEFGIQDTAMAEVVFDYNKIPKEKLEAAFRRVKEDSRRMGVDLYFQLFDDAEEADRWYNDPDYFASHHCLYPWDTARIKPSGDIALCPFIDYSVGNVKEGRFSEAWNGSNAAHFREVYLRNKGFPSCQHCCKLF